MKYKCGCLPKIHDERDYQFKDICDCPVGAEYYPTEYMNPLVKKVDILDQGGSMMCTAFAAAMYRYLYEYSDSNNRKMFSPTYIYGNRANNEYQGEGDYLRQVLNRLRKGGVCYRDTLYHVGSYSSCKQQYVLKKAVCDTEAYPFRLSSYYSLNTDNEVKKAIMTTGAVFVNYPIYDNWYSVGSNGIMEKNKGSYHGNHCVLIVGWKVIDNKSYWIILNSWSDYWGNKGVGYMPMEVHIEEAFCMVDEVQEVLLKLFKDIEDHWGRTNIEEMANKGIVTGYEDGTFKPDNSVTRAEIATIAKRIIEHIKG